MLQYILNENDRYSAAELAQMALEGGCVWLDIAMPSADDEQVKAVLVDEGVEEMCREAQSILTVDDRTELARELGLHGVRFTQRYFLTHPDATPMSLREDLGPEAIIGIETADAESLQPMVQADIDFVCLPAEFTAEQRKKFVDAANAKNVKIPLVAQGDLTAADAAGRIAEGFSAIAVGRSVSDAPDPVVAISNLLGALYE